MPPNLIFIFPGQASQYVGMGRDLYDHSIAARKVMDQVAAFEGLTQIPDVCFNGPEELLTRTDNVQPAITAVSAMALAALNEALPDCRPVACAGHSLGEYAAHFAAGNLTLEQAMRLVRWRGFWMNEASQPPNPEGAMLAVMGLALEKVEALVQAVSLDRVAVANLNSPGQIIVSGERSAIDECEKGATDAGAKRCVRLKVSGAWHSPLMKAAQEKMARLLNDELADGRVSFNSKIPVVANATADVVPDGAALRDTLTRQITSPVKWEDCVNRLTAISRQPSAVSPEVRDKSQTLFVEVGPGKVLKGLLRNIDRALETANVEDMASCEAVAEVVRNG